MLCKYARTLEDSFECGPGVFFGSTRDRGGCAGVELDGGTGGVFGDESGGDGTTDRSEGSEGAETRSGLSRQRFNSTPHSSDMM